MKTLLRFLVVGSFLTIVTSVFALEDTVAAPNPAQQTRPEPAPVIVAHRAALSATELVKYQQMEVEAEAKAQTQKQVAGAGMDTTTMVIVGAIVVVAVIAVASGGGGGGY